jgi:hypothetical protein
MPPRPKPASRHENHRCRTITQVAPTGASAVAANSGIRKGRSIPCCRFFRSNPIPARRARTRLAASAGRIKIKVNRTVHAKKIRTRSMIFP